LGGEEEGEGRGGLGGPGCALEASPPLPPGDPAYTAGGRARGDPPRDIFGEVRAAAWAEQQGAAGGGGGQPAGPAGAAAAGAGAGAGPAPAGPQGGGAGQPPAGQPGNWRQPRAPDAAAGPGAPQAAAGQQPRGRPAGPFLALPAPGLHPPRVPPPAVRPAAGSAGPWQPPVAPAEATGQGTAGQRTQAYTQPATHPYVPAAAVQPPAQQQQQQQQLWRPLGGLAPAGPPPQLAGWGMGPPVHRPAAAAATASAAPSGSGPMDEDGGPEWPDEDAFHDPHEDFGGGPGNTGRGGVVPGAQGRPGHVAQSASLSPEGQEGSQGGSSSVQGGQSTAWPGAGPGTTGRAAGAHPQWPGQGAGGANGRVPVSRVVDCQPAGLAAPAAPWAAPGSAQAPWQAPGGEPVSVRSGAGVDAWRQPLQSRSPTALARPGTGAGAAGKAMGPPAPAPGSAAGQENAAGGAGPVGGGSGGGYGAPAPKRARTEQAPAPPPHPLPVCIDLCDEDEVAATAPDHAPEGTILGARLEGGAAWGGTGCTQVRPTPPPAWDAGAGARGPGAHPVVKAEPRSGHGLGPAGGCAPRGPLAPSQLDDQPDRGPRSWGPPGCEGGLADLDSVPASLVAPLSPGAAAAGLAPWQAPARPQGPSAAAAGQAEGSDGRWGEPPPILYICQLQGELACRGRLRGGGAGGPPAPAAGAPPFPFSLRLAATFHSAQMPSAVLEDGTGMLEADLSEALVRGLLGGGRPRACACTSNACC
jgi:hypothetical protein